MKKIVLIVYFGFLTNVVFSQLSSEPIYDMSSFWHAYLYSNNRGNLRGSEIDGYPLHFENSISNTNLITLQQQNLIKESLEKYKSFNTNSRLQNAVLLGNDVSSNYCIMHFNYTNLDACEDVIFRTNPNGDMKGGGYEELVSPLSPGTSLIVRYRLKDHSGYDLIFVPNEPNKWKLAIFSEIKNNKPDGLVLFFRKNNSIHQLLHFSEGKAVNQFFIWKEHSFAQFTIKSPFDYFYFFTQKPTLPSSEEDYWISLLKNLYKPDSKTNLVFTLYTNCPPQFTNTIFNTNLLTLAQQKIIDEAPEKYNDFTTNSSLPGAILIGKEVSTNVSSNYCVLHFKYTNSAEYEDIIFQYSSSGFPKDRKELEKYLKGKVYESLVSPVNPGLGFVVRHRFEDQSGYDFVMRPFKDKKIFSMFAETKNDKANGLVVFFQDEPKSFQEMLHFVDGKAVGRWLMWLPNDNGLMQITIKSPMDYFIYCLRMGY